MLNIWCFLFLFVFSNIGVNLRSQPNVKSTVLPGIYQVDSLAHELNKKRVAIVANHTSVIENTHLVDTLLSLGVQISKIFSPEHGFAGKSDAGAVVKESALKNIPVISLYGKNKQPLKSDLSGVELIIFDLQDVGVRFYTYISTLHYVMQACAENKIPLIVLDRPNPNAYYIDGPVLNPNFKSFVGMHPVPVVYGMTIGEYALMINGEGWLEKQLSCNLTVIKIQNYTHNSLYTLPVKPSPNLPNMLSVYLYPSLCFFEGTTMSVGRGTNFPFQVYGHPHYPEPDFMFIPKSIAGASSEPLYENQQCFGVDLRMLNSTAVLDWKSINLNYLIETFKKMGKSKDFFNNYFDLLAGNDKLRQAILSGTTAESIRSSWKTDIENFKKKRVKYLLYP